MSPLKQVGGPDAEVDEIAWVPVSQAIGQLRYNADRKLLQIAEGAKEGNGELSVPPPAPEA
ncbi:MAG: hypothetical protein V3S55_07105 [Nitrospiraceae bacterium]